MNIEQQYDPRDWYWKIGSGDIYSSAAKGTVKSGDENYKKFISSGNIATPIDTMENLVEVLRAANIPPYHLVSSRVIVDRLQAAGKLEAADAALQAADLYTRQRWSTRDKIYADDPTAAALIKAIGADPVEILAPE